MKDNDPHLSELEKKLLDTVQFLLRKHLTVIFVEKPSLPVRATGEDGPDDGLRGGASGPETPETPHD